MSSYALLDQRFRMSPAERRARIEEYNEQGLVFSTTDEGLQYFLALLPTFDSNDDLNHCKFVVRTQLSYDTYRCVASYDRRTSEWNFSVSCLMTTMRYDLAD